jgi:hypothetical protein
MSAVELNLLETFARKIVLLSDKAKTQVKREFMSYKRPIEYVFNTAWK